MKLIILIISYLLSKYTIPVFQSFLFQSNYIKKNYRGVLIPNSMGIIYILNLLFLSPILFISINHKESINLFLLLIGLFIMGFVGLIDDFLGNRNVTGIKGHINMLIQGKITTGGIKALAGGMLAITVAIIVSETIIDGIVNFFLVSLFCNFINLLDLRPGRAIKIYIVLVLGLIILLDNSIEYILISTIGISLCYFPYDVKGQSMLGDTGANALGAILGISSTLLAIQIKVLLLIVLFIAHIYAEKKSISSLIVHNKFLRYIDNLGR